MVYRSPETHHSIFSWLEREIITISRELPYSLDDRKKIRIGQRAGLLILDNPWICGGRVIWRQCSQTKAVQILDIIMVVMQDNVLIGLIVAFLR